MSPKTRVISFDVGIKNMAYCIFEVTESIADKKPQITIIDWNILNMAATDTSAIVNIPLCQHITTSKKNRDGTCTQKVCGKKSKFHKDHFYVCEKHGKASTTLKIPVKLFTERQLQTMKMDALKQVALEEDNRLSETIEKMKKQELVNTIQCSFKQHYWDKITESKKTINASKLDLISIGRNLHKELSQLSNISLLTHVIIENQISPIANRMKTIQGMLAQYFIFHNIPHIEFVSSSNKLKYFLKDTIKSETANYKQHKTDGIQYCKQLLHKYFDVTWLAYLESYPQKKDDLADCFLQGIWYLNQKIITNAYNLKINNVTKP